MSEVKAVLRELAVWYAELPATTPAIRAAFEDVVLGLDCYQLNKQMMSPAMMRGLAQSIDALAHASSELSH